MDFSLQVAKQALLKEAKEGFNKNFAYSPLSINVMLNMIAVVGSKGHTFEQFLCFLGSKSVDDLNSKSSELMAVTLDEGSSENGGPLLSFVNGVWVDHRFTLKPSFQQILKSIYMAEAKPVDFVNKADEVIDEVNSWAENATRGLIKDILPDGIVDGNTMLFLAKALYFKGAWKHTFDASMTKNRNFYLLNGEEVQVPYMCQTFEEHFYGSFEGFKLIKLPYRNGEDDQRRFFMYFFLPDERDGLQNLLQQFNSEPGFLNQYFKLIKATVDHLMIPKFKFTYGFPVSETMKELGLVLPSINIREFTEMVDSPNGEVVRDVNLFHRSYIEINEEGTEAAAVTYEDLGCCLESPPPLNFIVDHPFMFMIRDDTSGIPLFVGAVLNPLLNN